MEQSNWNCSFTSLISQGSGTKKNVFPTVTRDKTGFLIQGGIKKEY